MAKARPGLSGLCSRALGCDGVHGGDKQPPKSRVDRGIQNCDLTISLVPTKGYHCLYVLPVCSIPKLQLYFLGATLRIL